MTIDGSGDLGGELRRSAEANGHIDNSTYFAHDFVQEDGEFLELILAVNPNPTPEELAVLLSFAVYGVTRGIEYCREVQAVVALTKIEDAEDGTSEAPEADHHSDGGVVASAIVDIVYQEHGPGVRTNYCNQHSDEYDPKSRPSNWS
ncbi:MAG TPA: hypothetical protein VIH90_06515 [Candidatus Saccharimonadales bacterium]